MADVLIALGANLGSRETTLRAATEQLAALPDTTLTAASRWVVTKPVGGPPGQGDFLNAAVRLQTALDPHFLGQTLLRIEAALGRERTEHWSARTLDLDLLLYDKQIIRTPELIVPHPRMAFRRFVLEPAVEIAADMWHPTLGATIDELWTRLNTRPNYVAVTGPIGAGKTHLALQLHQRFGGRLLQEPLSPAELTRFYQDPAGQGQAVEMRFLEQRAAQLAPTALANDGARLVVSDYWFAQSLAFARCWLAEPDRAAVEQQYQQWAAQVVAPKLIIALDAPPPELLRRMIARGRSYEQQVTLEQVEQLRRALRELLDQGGHGPILWLDTMRQRNVLEQATAAVEALGV